MASSPSTARNCWWRANPDRADRHVWIIGAVLLAAKYPPPFIYLTMMIGIDFLILALFARLNLRSERSALIVFGQTRLYIVHSTCWQLYPLCGWYRTFKRRSLATPSGASFDTFNHLCRLHHPTNRRRHLLPL